MNAKFVIILLFFLFINMCLNISPPSPPTYIRSEALVTRFQIEIASILSLALLIVCLFVYNLNHIDLSCRFISFNTRLNSLTVSAKVKKHENLKLFLLLLSYLLIFENYFVIFLPFDLCMVIWISIGLQNKSF